MIIPKAIAMDELVTVTADNAKIYNNSRNIELIGHVSITKGSTAIGAPKINIYKNDEHYSIYAMGGIVLSDNSANIKGSSNSCSYSTATNTIQMIDDVSIICPEMQLKGEVIEYDIGKKSFVVHNKLDNKPNLSDQQLKNRPKIAFYEK